MADEFVYVVVPEKWESLIYERLAELSRAGRHNDAGDPREPDSELVERMFLESYEGHQRLMRFLAGHAETWFYTSDLARELEITHGARGVAGMLGAFGRRAKHRYRGLKPWISEWDPGREESRHRMTSGVAAAIHAIAESTE